MDFQFASKLQTAMQNLGRTNGFAPPKSQDPADAVLHEYYVAETGRSLFDKRRKDALEKLKELDVTGVLDKALKNAVKGITGIATTFADTEHYTASHTTKAATETLDKTALRNELARLGVDLVTINKAFEAATKTNKPAETFTVSIKS